MYNILVATLAVLWAWSTLRYLMTSFIGVLSTVWQFTRAVHPLVVLGASRLVLDTWLEAAAVSGGVLLLLFWLDNSGPGQVVQGTLGRSSRTGLPRLP